MQGRDAARLDEQAAAFSVVGRCHAVRADLTVPADIAAARRLVTERGRLDALVLAAGIYERSSDPAVLARQMDANVHGPYALLQALLADLIAVKGQVIFINSTQGLNATREVGQYAATQHAMRAIADSLRDELNERGVRITSLFLGRTATRRQQAIFGMENRAYQPERLIQPADVACAVMCALQLPRTAEITNLMMRPMLKPVPA